MASTPLTAGPGARWRARRGVGAQRRDALAVHAHHLLVAGDDAGLDGGAGGGVLLHAGGIDARAREQLEQAAGRRPSAPDHAHHGDVCAVNSRTLRATLAAPPG